MKRRSWFANLGIAALLVSCAQTPQRSQAPATSSVANQSVAKVAPAGKPQSFSNPVVTSLPSVDVPAVPGLIRPTHAKARAAGIVTGRDDPFAALPAGPVRLKASTATRPSSPTVRPRPVSALAPLPTVPLPSLPTTPIAAPSAPLPTLALPPLPSMPTSKTAIADAIEVTGAMQVGGKWSVIVKEPEAQTSRYASTGEYLANGTVLVKRIIGGAGSDPTVILQQNGVEVTKSLGSSSGPIASN